MPRHVVCHSRCKVRLDVLQWCSAHTEFCERQSLASNMALSSACVPLFSGLGRKIRQMLFTSLASLNVFFVGRLMPLRTDGRTDTSQEVSCRTGEEL
jgi:hypothetical protein